jgi:transcriptional regulator with XRE-family HTH domain
MSGWEHGVEQPFGDMLKSWRGKRRMSQLDLSLAADVSSRHVAFLETGRSRPTRGMVIRLCEALEVPRARRNALLNAAGFAPAYAARDIDSDDMRDIRLAVDWMLERHAPWPAFAIDRHWRIVATNRPATILFAGLSLAAGDSLLEAFVHSAGLHAAIENWPEVARHMLSRLRTESAHLGGDPILDRAATDLAASFPDLAPLDGVPISPVVPARVRTGDVVLSLFSVIAAFGSAEDIALADLRIELMFPADDATRSALMGLA